MKFSKVIPIGIALILLVGGVLYFKPTSAPPPPNPSPTLTPTSAQSSLDEIVTQYLTQNYPDFKIVNSAEDPLCGGESAVDFSLENSKAEKMSLIFKPDGTFVQSEVDIPFSQLPSPVTNTIKADFKTYTYGDIVEKLTLANNQTQYLVDFDPKGTPFEGIFDSSGVLVCSSKPL